MLRILFTIVLLQFSIFTLSFGQDKGRIPVICQTDLSDAEVTDTRLFNDESLYGYIDGGAEFYLEYGFDTLLLTDLKGSSGDIKVEVYRMKDAEAAFGIFSVSHYKCFPGKDLTQYFCRSQYQLQFCKGCYYVSIVNSNGTEAEQQLSEKAALILLDRIEGNSFDPSVFFSDGIDDNLMKSSVLVRGRLGLYNGAYGLSETLEECAGYTALIIKPVGATVASIRFSSEEAMNIFIDKSQIDKNGLMAGKESETASGDVVVLKDNLHLLLTIR